MKKMITALVCCLIILVCLIGITHLIDAREARKTERETTGAITIITVDGNEWEIDGKITFDTKGTVNVEDDEIIEVSL